MGEEKKMKFTAISLLSLSFLVQAYVMVIVVWFASWLVVGDANWVLVLLNRAGVYLFLPIPFLLVLSLIQRHIKLVYWLLAPIAVFLGLYNPYFLSKNTSYRSDYYTLSVMTYNVLYSNKDYDAVASAILKNYSDLVALQEVQPEMMEELQKRLQKEFPYSILGNENDYGTTAVFSRFPFVDSYVLDLQADRPAVVVTVEVPGGTVAFVSAHLLAYNLWRTELEDIPTTVMERTYTQNRQANIILNEIKSKTEIVVMGCDCNRYETSSSYRILDEMLDNSARTVEWLAAITSPVGANRDLALDHIDFVWYKGNLTSVGTYKIFADGGSDHIPILATFVINVETK